MHPALRPFLGLALIASSVLSLPGAAAQAQEDNRPEPQEPVNKRAARKKPEPKDYSADFLTLKNAWAGAMHDYSTALLHYDRENAALPPEKRDPKGPPVHPAADWWQRFVDLGRAGDPDALEWQVEQATNAFPEPARAAAEAEKAFKELLRTNPEHRTVEDALDALRSYFDAFGREHFLAILDSARTQSKDSETQARALVLKAWAVTDRFRNDAPETEQAVEKIYEEILYGHPGTRAAREIAGRVETGLERDFLKAELAWIDAVRALQKQGKGPADWPQQPMHEWNTKFVPVAAAGGPQANKFVNHVFPGYQQAEGNGIGFGLVWLQSWWMIHAPMAAPDWVRARLGLIEIITREFHGQPLVTSAMVDLAKDSSLFPLEYLEPALAPVLADDSAPKAQALALFTHALALTARNQWSDWQQARTELERVQQKFPTEDIAARAHSLLASMLNVWPGHKAPDFRGTDQEGLAFKLEDYKGFVCVVDFGNSQGGLSAEDIARRRELIKSFEGRPFRWIGGLLEPRTQRTFQDSFGAAGVNWRCALLGTRQSDIAAQWSISYTPTVFLVDAEGVIRARNVPWDELQSQIQKLVTEVEAKRSPR